MCPPFPDDISAILGKLESYTSDQALRPSIYSHSDKLASNVVDYYDSIF